MKPLLPSSDSCGTTLKLEQLQWPAHINYRGSHAVIGSFWRKLRPWLDPRMRVVRFDWAVDPTHFDSVRYGHLEGYVDDLLAIVEATSSAPCTFIGHSMSAMIGMLAAKQQPSAFKQMVMIAGAPCYVSHAEYGGGFSAESIANLLDQIEDDYLAWFTTFAPVTAGDPHRQDIIDDFQGALKAMRPPATGERLTERAVRPQSWQY